MPWKLDSECSVSSAVVLIFIFFLVKKFVSMQHCNYKNQSILVMALCRMQSDLRAPSSLLTCSWRHLMVPAWCVCLCSVAGHGTQCLEVLTVACSGGCGSVEEAGCHSPSSQCLMVQKSPRSAFWEKALQSQGVPGDRGHLQINKIQQGSVVCKRKHDCDRSLRNEASLFFDAELLSRWNNTCVQLCTDRTWVVKLHQLSF